MSGKKLGPPTRISSSGSGIIGSSFLEARETPLSKGNNLEAGFPEAE
jgi:hypothetical protein